MNTSKKININVSSLVGLKAELLRKHTEVKDAKAKIDTSKPALVNKTKVKKKKVNVKDNEVKKIENITEIEDVETLKKSKYMLLAKAKLYDKLKKNREEGNDNYLVDFQNKNYESSGESSVEEDDYEDSNLDPEEDWVDYKDCFGRTRRCLRKDLPRMKEKDSLIEREITKKSHTEEIEEHIQPPVFIPPEKEPEIEIMRKKWEEQTEKLTKKSDIHYQDILFDEARAHGVGYYAFSQDEEERTKQQLNLTKIRKETEQKQKELKEMQDLKNKMEENRLKTARIRARVRAGLPPEPTEEEIENNSPNNESTVNNENTESKSPKNDELVEQDLTKANDKNSLMVVEDKIKAFGELLGKRLPWRELSQDEWIDKRRKDRHGEFAPVYDNFKRGEKLMATRHNQLITSSNDADDPLRIKAGGPEPTDFWESSAPSNIEDDDNTAVELDKSDKTSVSGQSTNPMNLTESPPFIQSVPPPLFNPSVPPPSINSDVLSLPIPAVNSTVIPLAPVFYPVPYPSFTNPSISSQVTLNDLQNTEINHGCPMESTDSDDSDIIGPMPPPPPSSSSTKDDDILARIPLPDQPPPPPTIRESSSNYSNKQSENHSTNANIDKIEAGLKYLRRKFETNDGS